MSLALAQKIREYKDVILDVVNGINISYAEKIDALNMYSEKEYPNLKMEPTKSMFEYYLKTKDQDIRATLKAVMRKRGYPYISDMFINYPNFDWKWAERRTFIELLFDKKQHQQCLRLIFEKAYLPHEREPLLDFALSDGPTINIFIKNNDYTQDDIQLLQANALKYADVAKAYHDNFRKEITPELRKRLFKVMLKDSQVASVFLNRKKTKATDEEKQQLFMSMLEKPKNMMYHVERHVPDLIGTPERQKMFFNKHKDWLIKTHYRNDSTKFFSTFKDALDEDAIKHILKILSRLRTNKLGLIGCILKAYDENPEVLSKQTYDELNTLWTTEMLLK